MSQVIIENPVLNSPFEEPKCHFRFNEDGITNEIVESRRVSSYFVPIPRPKKKSAKQLAFETEWTKDRVKENEFINRVRGRIECGIVKVPRVPVADDAMVGEQPTYRDLWLRIREQLPKKGGGTEALGGEPSLPVELEGALQSLYDNYQKYNQSWEANTEGRARGLTHPPSSSSCLTTRMSPTWSSVTPPVGTRNCQADRPGPSLGSFPCSATSMVNAGCRGRIRS